MITKQLIELLFPKNDSIHLKGMALGSTKEELSIKEGEPDNTLLLPGSETWLYQSKKYSSILMESSFEFGKKPILKRVEIYLSFSYADFTDSEVEKIRNAFVSFLNENLGQSLMEIVKTDECNEYYFKWKIAKSKKKIDLIDYLQMDSSDPYGGNMRVIKITQS
jgi:hypothetical protein